MPEQTLAAVLRSWPVMMGWLSLYGAILLGGALLAERLLGRRMPTVVHALWTLVVLRLLLPPDLASGWSVAGVLLPRLNTSSGPASQSLALASPPPAPLAAAPFPWWQLGLLALWLPGVAAVTAILVRHWRHGRAMLAAGAPLTRDDGAAILEACRRRLRIHRPVRVLVMEREGTPFTMGLLRPVVALPCGARSWPSTRLEAVLAHELAHVARLDILWLRLENLVQALFFFHPAAWIAPRRLGRLRELLCDRLALAGGELDTAVYARSLLDTLRTAPGGGSLLEPAGPALAETKEGMHMRLLDMERPARGVPPRLVITLAALALLGGLLLPMAPAAAGPEPDTSAKPVRYTKDSGLTEPRRIEAPQPTYPEEARRQRIEGTVVLDVLIGTDGAVHDVKVLRPMPGGLTEAAEKAVRRWKFEPARNAEGQAVPVYSTLAVRFLLSRGTSAPVPSSSNLPEGTKPPIPISHPSPVYPEGARQKRVQGTVVLEVDVGADGTVHGVTVVRGLPEGLTEAAVEAVRNWRFKPAIGPEGKPVTARVVETIRFVLAGGNATSGAAPAKQSGGGVD